MHFDLWTILLIASGSQCLFLLLYFITNRAPNKAARGILIVLLSVVLFINISNFISSSHLYRSIPRVAGFDRGMVLLLGPLLFLYAMSVIKADFTIKFSQLLHFLPYAIALIIIVIQIHGISNKLLIASIDSLVAGTVRMNWILNLWFASYFIHLLVYSGITYYRIRMSIDSMNKFVISLKEREKMLRSFALIFGTIALLFLAIWTYVFVTGLYTIGGNLLYTLVLAVLVYFIAYQAILNRDLLAPGFSTKYASQLVNKGIRISLLTRLKDVFEKEKIFINPNLKISNLAKILGTNSHVVSQIINDELDMNFSEMVNKYRVDEFKSRVSDPKYSHYSIMGIANDVGFKSKSTFNTVFKKIVGLTPSEFLTSIHKG